MDGIVTDREGFTLAAEDHFLMRHQSRQPNRMHGDALGFAPASTRDQLLFVKWCRDFGAGFGKQICGFDGGSGGGIGLAVVVQFYDLHMREVLHGIYSVFHHQHRTDGKVWGDHPADLFGLAKGLKFGDLPRKQPTGPDHGPDAALDERPGVVVSHRCGGEIHRHLHPGISQHRRKVVTKVRLGDQFQPGLLCDGLHRFLSHAALGTVHQH